MLAMLSAVTSWRCCSPVRAACSAVMVASVITGRSWASVGAQVPPGTTGRTLREVLRVGPADPWRGGALRAPPFSAVPGTNVTMCARSGAHGHVVSRWWLRLRSLQGGEDLLLQLDVLDRGACAGEHGALLLGQGVPGVRLDPDLGQLGTRVLDLGVAGEADEAAQAGVDCRGALDRAVGGRGGGDEDGHVELLDLLDAGGGSGPDLPGPLDDPGDLRDPGVAGADLAGGAAPPHAAGDQPRLDALPVVADA